MTENLYKRVSVWRGGRCFPFIVILKSEIKRKKKAKEKKKANFTFETKKEISLWLNFED